MAFLNPSTLQRLGSRFFWKELYMKHLLSRIMLKLSSRPFSIATPTIAEAQKLASLYSKQPCVLGQLKLPL